MLEWKAASPTTPRTYPHQNSQLLSQCKWKYWYYFQSEEKKKIEEGEKSRHDNSVPCFKGKETRCRHVIFIPSTSKLQRRSREGCYLFSGTGNSDSWTSCLGGYLSSPSQFQQQARNYPCQTSKQPLLTTQKGSHISKWVCYNNTPYP